MPIIKLLTILIANLDVTNNKMADAKTMTHNDAAIEF